MTSPDERPGGPEDPDERAWAELVRAFHASPDHSPNDAADPRWPAAEDLPPDEVRDHTGPAHPADDADSRDESDDHNEDGDTLSVPGRTGSDTPAVTGMADRFVPPHPPPIPRGDRVSRLAWAGVIGPPTIVLLSGLTSIRVPTNIMVFLALAFIAGFGTLVYRMRQYPSDPDDGAVL